MHGHQMSIKVHPQLLQDLWQLLPKLLPSVPIVAYYYVAFANAQWQWRPALILIAIVTMVFGSVVAIAQRDVKRMLAYSSIAHAGFLLAGVIALSKSGLDATLFYLFAYGIATVGAFGVVTLVRDSAGEVTDLNRWSGLG
jgi:NADH-quinone oxidoreductase subunit N